MPSGWLTKPEQAALKELSTDRVVLEIGAWQGLSAVTIGATAAGLASLDHWQGDQDTRRVAGDVQRGDLLDRYLTAVELAGVAPAMLIGSMEQLLPMLDPTAFDVLFYDADHRPGPTMQAVDWAADVCGAIAVHDYKPKGYPDTCDALDRWYDHNSDQGWAMSLIGSLAIYSRLSE